MTQHEKDINRRRIIWFFSISLVGYVFLNVILVALSVEITALTTLSTIFVPSAAGLISANFFASPKPDIKENSGNSKFDEKP